MAQDIVDRTHQASHSARNRRASIVREVSQTESETISTRTLTNYNHMHALTVEYYEVVQLYRTIVELSKADRCLFVPMKLVDFSDLRIVNRYRQVIAARGLHGDVRLLSLAESDHFALWAPLRVGPWNVTSLMEAERGLGTKVGAPTDTVLSFPSSFVFSDVYFQADAPFDALVVTLASGEIVNIPLALEGALGVSPLSGSLHRSVNDTQSGRVFGERLREVRSVAVRKKADAGEFAGTIGVGLFDFSSLPQIDGPFRPLSWSISVPKDSTSAVLFEMQPTTSKQGLIDHLQDNRLYYSQAIWRALDPATIGILLSGYTWPLGGQAKPLVEFVDPNPVAIVANYLVLRISGDDEKEHAAWLGKKKIKVGSRREDQVPVPSGGVFAEAVLGRFNSAEKLDITRFWNWQDSPIPIQAPDIAAIQAGSRRDPDNTVPGQLSAPVLNIVNAPSLPDPQGMGAVLAAIQNGNMFRDMSGLAATIGLAQAGLAGAQQSATDAAAQAGKNAEVAAQFGAKMAETAAKLVSAYFTGGASLAGGGAGGGRDGIISDGQGISKAGSLLNYARDMDQRSGQTPTGQPVLPASAGGGAGAESAQFAATSAPDSANEDAAFGATVGTRSGGPLGLLNDIMGGTTPRDAGVPTLSRSLVGDAGGSLDLSKAMKDYLDSLVGPEGGTCVAVSLLYFTSAMRTLGVQTLTVPTDTGPIDLPSIATQNGTILSARALAAIWYSNTSATSWARLPAACRGAGAPGALLYGDLVEGRSLTTSKVGWPQGMTPGAHLQLWRSEEEYKDLRDSGVEPTLGHSCVFQAYVVGDPSKIVVSDQMGVAHEVKYPYFGLTFVMAGNLSKARLLSAR